MTWTLLKQDPAVQTLRASLMLGFFGALLLRRIMGDFVAGPPDVLEAELKAGWLLFVYAMGWSTALLFVISGNVSTRCSQLSLSLPIPARRLWSVRLVALLTAGLVPILVITLITALQLNTTAFRLSLQTDLLTFGLHAAAGLALTILILQSPQPGLQTIGRGAPHIIFLVIVSVGMLFVALATAAWPITAALFIGLAQSEVVIILSVANNTFYWKQINILTLNYQKVVRYPASTICMKSILGKLIMGFL